MNLRTAEFRILRETIAWRGTVRMGLIPIVVCAWAISCAILLLWTERGLAATLPLLILTAGFEAVHALHVGVERIGRYLQVFYEDAFGDPLWESTAVRLGPGLPGGGVDPLFTLVFVLAALVNLLLLLPRAPGTIPTAALLVAFHGAFIVRLVRARGAASRQRAVDLESMRAVRAGLAGSQRSPQPLSRDS